MPEYIDDPDIDSKINEHTSEAKAELKVAEDACNFLMRRTMEYIKVPIVSEGDVQAIEIRSRLTKKESIRFSKMLDIWDDALAGNADAFEGHDDTIAEFLEYITKDKKLNFEFWMSFDLDEEIIRTVLLTYFTQPAANMVRIWKFRS